MRLLGHESPEGVELGLGRRQQFFGGRMIGLNGHEHLGRCTLGVDLPRTLGKRRLIPAKVAFGDREQIVERQLDHLVGGELSPVAPASPIAKLPFDRFNRSSCSHRL